MKLSTQFAILTSTLIAVLFAGVAFFQTDRLSKHFDQQQQAWSKLLTVALAESMARDVINGNAIEVREFMEHIVSSNDEVDYLYVTDFDHHIFAHTFADGFPAKIYKHLGEHVDSFEPRQVRLDGREYLESSFPIIEGMESHLHVGFDRRRNEVLSQKMFTDLAGLFILAVSGGIVLILVLGRYLLGPLAELTSQLQLFGEGAIVTSASTSTSTSMPFASREIRNLETSFQEMIVHRQQEEEKLLRTNDQLQISIEHMPNAYILWDKDLQVIEWNKAAEKIFGYSKQEMLGKNPVNYIVPEPVRHFVADALRKLEIGKVADYSEKDNNIRKDGEPISCQWFNTPLTDNNGNIFGILTLAQDITERVAMEEALYKASELNESIIKESPIGIVIYEEGGQCIAANKSVAKIIGASREQVLEQNFRNIQSWKKFGLLDKAEAALESGERGRGEFYVTTTFDKQAICDCIFIPFWQHEKQHLLVMIDDISKRKATENALKESEALLEMAQQLAHVGHWKLDLETFHLEGSDELYRLFGLAKGDLTINDFINVIHEDDRDEAASVFPGENEQGEDKIIEYRVVHSDGTEKWVHARGEVIADKAGNFTQAVGTVHDITEIKLAEEELRNHRDHLENLVKERTQKLQDTQDELVRKERLATLGQLTATVSHELRNPLGAMRPSLYVIDKKSDKQDEHVQKAIGRIDRNIDRCDRIIDELLDFTRIVELNKHDTRIDEWLESIISDQIIPKGIHLEKELSLENVELPIDVDRLRRAVINVLENGCHAMMDDNQQVVDQDNSRLNIKTQGNKERIEISITDTGSGIPKDVLDKVFEPLFSTKGFGIGLGMPTVKQIMEQHGGGIEIDSEEGKGTRVSLWLPRKKSEEVAA